MKSSYFSSMVRLAETSNPFRRSSASLRMNHTIKGLDYLISYLSNDLDNTCRRSAPNARQHTTGTNAQIQISPLLLLSKHSPSKHEVNSPNSHTKLFEATAICLLVSGAGKPINCLTPSQILMFSSLHSSGFGAKAGTLSQLTLER